MSSSASAYLMVGVRLSRDSEAHDVIKYNEDTGQPYKKTEQRRFWRISGTDIKVDIDKTELGWNTAGKPMVWYSYRESTTDFVLGIAVQYVDDDKKMSREVIDCNMHDCRAQITKYLKEHFQYTGPINLYLLLHTS